MDRATLEQYILDYYNVKADYPWDSPTDAVFRHEDNRKWFALMMDISARRLGIDSDETVCVMNVKCDPLLIGALVREDGLFPAYHMNKEHWLTVLVNERTDEERLYWLLDMSFEITKTRPKIRRNKR